MRSCGEEIFARVGLYRRFDDIGRVRLKDAPYFLFGCPDLFGDTSDSSPLVFLVFQRLSYVIPLHHLCLLSGQHSYWDKVFGKSQSRKLYPTPVEASVNIQHVKLIGRDASFTRCCCSGASVKRRSWEIERFCAWHKRSYNEFGLSPTTILQDFLFFTCRAAQQKTK